MFQPFEFRDLHQSAYRLVVKDFAIRREYRSELEREHFTEPPTDCAIDSNLFVRLLTSEAGGLKDDGGAAVIYDLIHLLPVERNDITVESFYISAGDEGVTS